jgi:site-specific DNA-methyltransferase (adenine-specific)
MIELIHGDCLEEMKKIPDGSIDLVLTDPPYGTTACKWDTCIPFEPMWEQLKRITKKNGAIVLFGSQPFTSSLVMSNVKMFKYEWVWEKTMAGNFLHAQRQPLKKHENISVFYQLQPTYNPQKVDGKEYTRKGAVSTGNLVPVAGKLTDPNFSITNSGRFPHTVQKFSNGNNGNVHPTQKPVALMEYLIKTYTNEGETVLDFTMGSGTTGVACKNLNRNFIGIELDKEYFEIAKKRIN